MNALLNITVRVSGNASADAAKVKAALADVEVAAKAAGQAVGNVGSVPGGYSRLTEQLAAMATQADALDKRLSSLGKTSNYSSLNAQLTAVQARIAALGDAIEAVNAKGFDTKNFAALANMSAGVSSSLTTLSGKLQKAEEANDGWIGGMNKALTATTNYGKQIQWVGRQVEEAFTVPIALAGGLAVDFALKQEKALAQLQANYGATGQSAASLRGDLDLLNTALTELSDTYGISKTTLTEVATDYAKAGAAGAQLAQDVKNVAQVMVISGDDNVDVTTKLIGLQEAYKYSASQMQDAIEQMVVVTKDSPASFADLAEAMRTSAGAAQEAGIPMSQLAALIAALTPAAGDVETAGNAMRTIISRLMNPSADYTKLLGMMGLNTKTVAWQSESATQKLLDMARAMDVLTPAQKAAVDSAASSRFQIDRFSVLIQDLQQPLGNYAKATQDTADKQKVFAQYTKELQGVLASNPQAFEILWQQLQNALVQIVIPLLPALEGLVSEISRMVQAFARLSPGTQQFILLGAAMLAVVGPVLRYVGAFAELIGVFGKVALWPVRLIAGLLGMNEAIGGLLKFPFQAVGDGVGAMVGKINGAFDSSVEAAGVATTGIEEAFVAAMEGAAAAVVTATETMNAAFYGMVPPAEAAAASMGGAFASAAAASTVAWIAAADGTIIPILGELGAGSAVAAGVAVTGWDTAAAALIAVWVPTTAALGAGTMAMGELMAGTAGGVLVAWEVAAAGIEYAVEVGVIAIGTGFVALGELMAGVAAGALVSWQATAAGFTALWAVSLDGVVVPAMLELAAVMDAVDAEIIASNAAAVAAVALEWQALPALMAVSVVEPIALEAGAAAAAFPDAIVVASTEIPAAAEGIVAELGGVFSGILVSLGEILSAAWAALSGVLLEILEGAAEAAAAIGGLFGPDEIILIVAGLVALGVLVYKYFGDIEHWVSDFGSWIVNTFSDAWNALPEIVAGAIEGVISVLDAAVGDVKDLLSYLNPFAHHSPSLVDNVQDGLAVVASEYGNLTGSGGVYEQASNAHQTFVNSTAGPQQTADKQRSTLVKADGPAAGAAFDAQEAAMRRLQGVLDALTVDYDKQKEVVAGWKTELEQSTQALNGAQQSLKLLQEQASATSKTLSDAKSDLQALLQTPIQGMQAMSDAIFNNSMAQKQLQLQIDQLQDVNGQYVDLTKTMADYQGQVEMLEAKTTSLRQAGAGSDVLAPYLDQLHGIQGLQHDFSDRANQVQQLTDKLTALQHAGDELSLQQSLMFDPLTRQLQEASSTIKEMPFDQLLASVKATAGQIATLQPIYDQQNAAVAAQQTVVDGLTASHDALQQRYDSENQKLTDLKNAYDAASQAMQTYKSDIGSAVSGASSAISAAAAAKKPKKPPALDSTLSNFNTGALDQGLTAAGAGSTNLANLNGGNLKDLVDQWSKDAQKQFGGFDIFSGVKKKIEDFKSWFKEQMNIGTLLGASLGGAAGFALGGPVGAMVGVLIGAVAGDLVHHFAPQIGKVLETAWRDSVGALDRVWNDIWQPITRAFDGTLDAVKGAFTSAWDGITAAARAVWSTALKPVFDAIAAVVRDVLIPGFDIFRDVFMTVWRDVIAPQLKVAWAIMKPIFDIFAFIVTKVLPPAFEQLAAIFEIAFYLIKDIVVAVWTHSVYPVLKAMYDFVVHDLGPIIMWLYNNVVKPIFGLIGAIISFVWHNSIYPSLKLMYDFIHNYVGPAVLWIWHNVVDPAFSAIGAAIKSTWDHVIFPALSAFHDFLVNTVAPAITWFRDKVIDPVFNGIGDIISGVWNDIDRFLANAVNIGIHIFNAISHGIKDIGGLVGVKVHISDIPDVRVAGAGSIPHHASGAIMASEVGAGFLTNGPRAIVGEGNPNYPEWVIPSDPMYRANAMALASHMMKTFGVPGFSIGGLLNDLNPVNDAKAVYRAGTSALRDIAGLAFDTVAGPIKSGIEAMINRFPQPDWLKNIENGVINTAFNGIKGIFNDQQKKQAAAGGSTYTGGPIPGYSGSPGVAQWEGVAQQVANMLGQPTSTGAILRRIGAESGGNPTIVNKWDINWQEGHPSVGLAQVIAGTFKEYAGQFVNTGPFEYGVSVNPLANVYSGMNYATHNYGSIAAIDPIVRNKGYATGGIMGMLPMGIYDTGGFLPRGLSLAFNGTGKQEAVLTHEQSAGRAGNTLVFNGDLSFPNIKSGDDADTFIRNLESLAK